MNLHNLVSSRESRAKSRWWGIFEDTKAKEESEKETWLIKDKELVLLNSGILGGGVVTPVCTRSSDCRTQNLSHHIALDSVTRMGRTASLDSLGP